MDDQPQDLKLHYASEHSVAKEDALRLNLRLFNTYARIAQKVCQRRLSGKQLDLGCGDRMFSLVCQHYGIDSYGLDYPQVNLECDKLDFLDGSIDFVTMNAVIEHISNASHVLSEVMRLLKPQGLLFIRTPNWHMCAKDFYNDPTHVKPYTPASLRRVLELAGFKVIFLKPGLVEKKWFWWDLPEPWLWWVASILPGGTKSIIAVAIKEL